LILFLEIHYVPNICIPLTLVFFSFPIVNQPKRRKNKENKKENQNQKPFHESVFPDEFILKEAKRKEGKDKEE